MIEILDAIDAILLVAGTIVCIGFLLGRYRAKRVPQDAFDLDRRLKPNGLTPEYILVPIVAFMVSFYVTLPLWGPAEDEISKMLHGLIANGIAQTAGAVACVWVLHRTLEGSVLTTAFGRTRHLQNATYGLVLLLAALPLCTGAYEITLWLTQRFAPAYELSTHRVLQVIHEEHVRVWVPIVLWAGSAMVTPVAEEFFFRGVVQGAIRNAVGRSGPAIFIGGGVFAMAHMDQPHVIPTMWVLGIVLGYAYERTGSLLAPIVIHALFNVKTLAWDYLANSPGTV